MKNSQKGFLVPFLLTIIALLLIGGGLYIFNNEKEKELAAANAEMAANAESGLANQSDQSGQSGQNAATDVKANTKRFQNTEDNISFDIPSSWKVTHVPKSEMAYTQDWEWNSYTIQSPDFNEVVHEEMELPYAEVKQGAQIDVVSSDRPKTVQVLSDIKIMNEAGHDSGPILKNARIMQVAGKEVLLYDATDRGGAMGYYMQFIYQDKLVTIDMRYKGMDGKAVFDTILSTFAFEPKK